MFIESAIQEIGTVLSETAIVLEVILSLRYLPVLVFETLTYLVVKLGALILHNYLRSRVLQLRLRNRGVGVVVIRLGLSFGELNFASLLGR